jgi:hypothetical protein
MSAFSFAVATAISAVLMARLQHDTSAQGSALADLKAAGFTTSLIPTSQGWTFSLTQAGVSNAGVTWFTRTEAGSTLAGSQLPDVLQANLSTIADSLIAEAVEWEREMACQALSEKVT